MGTQSNGLVSVHISKSRDWVRSPDSGFTPAQAGTSRSSNQHLPQTEETGAILADREDNSNTSNKFRQQVSILEYIDSSSEYIGGL